MSFYEERMYFLYDTRYGSVFSTFSYIFWPKMEKKTFQYADFLDSATRSTSYQWASKFILVAEKLIF